MGCSGGGVIGAGREVEHRPGFAMTAAHLPDVYLAPFHITDKDLPDGDASPEAWETLVKTSADREPHFILLADPFSLRGEHLLMGLDYAFPSSVKIGGLASGANQPGGNALYLSDEVHDSGAVGLALHGDIAVDTVVAQGCRPIGEPMQVTECERNLLLALNGRPPLEVLRELFQELSERDRQLAQHSLFLGVVMDELKDEPKIGDFLIRNIMGMDPQRGAGGDRGDPEGGTDGPVPPEGRRDVGGGPGRHADPVCRQPPDTRRGRRDSVLLLRTRVLPVRAARP